MRKFLAVAVVLVIVASAAAFAEATPEVKGPVLALSAVTGGKDDAENKLFEAALEKATGPRDHLGAPRERLRPGADGQARRGRPLRPGVPGPGPDVPACGAGGHPGPDRADREVEGLQGERAAGRAGEDRAQWQVLRGLQQARGLPPAQREQGDHGQGRHRPREARHAGRLLPDAEKGEGVHGDDGREDALLSVLRLHDRHLGPAALVLVRGPEAGRVRRLRREEDRSVRRREGAAGVGVAREALQGRPDVARLVHGQDRRHAQQDVAVAGHRARLRLGGLDRPLQQQRPHRRHLSRQGQRRRPAGHQGSERQVPARAGRRVALGDPGEREEPRRRVRDHRVLRHEGGRAAPDRRHRGERLHDGGREAHLHRARR